MAATAAGNTSGRNMSHRYVAARRNQYRPFRWMFQRRVATEEPPAAHGRSDWHDTVFAHPGTSTADSYTARISTPDASARTTRTTRAGPETGRSERPAADRRATPADADPV